METLRALMVSLLLLCTSACCGPMYNTVAASWCDSYYVDPRYEQTRYPVRFKFRPDAITPQGIRVDTSGLPVDLLRIDDLTDEFEACYGKPVKRCGLRVKIVPPTLVTPDGRESFYCGTGETGFCTGLTQYPALVLVTPNLAAYKHELVHDVAHRDHGDRLFRCE